MSFITTTWDKSIAAKLSYVIWTEIETEDFYRDIEKDVEKMLDTSGYSTDENRPLPIGNNKRW